MPEAACLQSLWLTLVGFYRMMDGTFPHVAQGTLLASAGLLFDRADQWLMETKGRPSPWTLYLGIVFDRLVEIVLVGAAAWLAVLGYGGYSHHAILTFQPGTAIVVAVVAAGLHLAHRALEAAGDVLVLRQHLLSRQRLPAPMRVVRGSGARPYLGRFVGRDEWMLGWAIGLMAGEPAIVLLAGVALGLGLVVEDLILVHIRLRQSEARSSLLLGPEYP